MRKVKVWTLVMRLLIYCRSHLVSYCLVREGRLPMLLLVYRLGESSGFIGRRR